MTSITTRQLKRYKTAENLVRAFNWSKLAVGTVSQEHYRRECDKWLKQWLKFNRADSYDLPSALPQRRADGQRIR